jgi:hypothetical protein
LKGNNEARTLLAFPPEADEPMVQAKIFISFWLKPDMFYNLAIPDINVGATLNIICVTSDNNMFLGN